ncbi:7657_t:CDS:2 [Ambispora gerdemannii]|uniref:7657_t:CDS:1 n=1 Tax=Ambispora gerdemannii TaxID=144530 RepID=A0A9N9GH36_9GLOM|nr:7657_t:CDS:2 [Ambispora gerdemannii]
MTSEFDEFSPEQWIDLVKRRPDEVQKTYHHEIEHFIAHFFGISGKKVWMCGFGSETLAHSDILDF